MSQRIRTTTNREVVPVNLPGVHTDHTERPGRVLAAALGRSEFHRDAYVQFCGLFGIV